MEPSAPWREIVEQSLVRRSNSSKNSPFVVVDRVWGAWYSTQAVESGVFGAPEPE
jgi:hypothetical protein